MFHERFHLGVISEAGVGGLEAETKIDALGQGVVVIEVDPPKAEGVALLRQLYIPVVGTENGVVVRDHDATDAVGIRRLSGFGLAGDHGCHQW